MKILLILPAAEHLRVLSADQKIPKRAMLRFSILPLTVVAALTPRKHSVAICDENVQAVDFDTDADVIGISFMTALAPRAYELADEFRRRGKIVIAGGFHPTFCPDEAAGHFDSVVVGEAEGSWSQALADIEAGKLQPTYRRTSPADLAGQPEPRRDLVGPNASQYVTTSAVQTGRGCSHGCRYCSISAFHQRTYRTRPLPEVLAELQRVPRDFMFVDDNIIADPDYAKALFTAMIPLRKRWVSQCSLKIADDPHLLALARSAGCRGLFIGVETLSEQNLADMDKGFNQAAEYKRRLSAIRSAGIGVCAGIMVGMDGDDVTVFQRTLRFLQKARIDAIQLNILTPLPGTAFYDDFDRQGRIIDRDWSHYDFRHTVIRPARMTSQELQEGADWLYSGFYRLDRIIVRTLRALWSLGLIAAVLVWRLNMTYRYDNKRERIRGRNPARSRPNTTAIAPRKSRIAAGVTSLLLACMALLAAGCSSNSDLTPTEMRQCVAPVQDVARLNGVYSNLPRQTPENCWAGDPLWWVLAGERSYVEDRKDARVELANASETGIDAVLWLDGEAMRRQHLMLSMKEGFPILHRGQAQFSPPFIWGAADQWVGLGLNDDGRLQTVRKVSGTSFMFVMPMEHTDFPAGRAFSYPRVSATNPTTAATQPTTRP